MNRRKQCGPRSDCSLWEQSDLGLHYLSKRVCKTFPQTTEQMTFVLIDLNTSG